MVNKLIRQRSASSSGHSNGDMSEFRGSSVCVYQSMSKYDQNSICLEQGLREGVRLLYTSTNMETNEQTKCFSSFSVFQYHELTVDLLRNTY